MKHYFLTVAQDEYEMRGIIMSKQADGTHRGEFDEGVRVSHPVQVPIEIELEIPDYPEYINIPCMWQIPLVLRGDLLKDMRDFGVDNIDAYQAIIRDPRGGDVLANYFLCNVIGLVDVFDMQASELHPDSPPEVAYLFNKIVIDEKKAEGHHFFRPYGRMSQLLVSEALKTYLESKNTYPELEFSEPEDFA